MVNADRAWADAQLEQLLKKADRTAAENADKIPYITENGRFNDCSGSISWWTNGFYAGQLWQLYHASAHAQLRATAENIEKKLDASLMSYMGMDHDSGFKWLLTSVANYKLTGNPDSKNRALLAAANLAGRFNPAGRFLRAWNDSGDGEVAGWAIIDCMMNLPLLYWAQQETKDPRFGQIASAHADTVMRCFIRPDGSVKHIVRFDPATGEMIDNLGGQGMDAASSWTRGQAWALYGFCLCWLHTQKEQYLQTAEKVARYFVSCIPESGLIPVDFCQPAACEWEDSSAAAVAACGLLELEKAVSDPGKQAFFHDAAMKMLKALAQNRCDYTDDTDNILTHCSAAYHCDDHNMALIYGDYYYTEAVLKLCGKELFMW